MLFSLGRSRRRLQIELTTSAQLFFGHVQSKDPVCNSKCAICNVTTLPTENANVYAFADLAVQVSVVDDDVGRPYVEATVSE